MANLIDALGESLQTHGKRRFIYLQDSEYQSLSFAEIHDQIEQLASQLENLGVRPGMPIGICADNSINWVLYDLALTRLGAVVVGLPQTLLVSKLDLVECYGLSTLLLSDGYYKQYAANGTRVLNMDIPLAQQHVVVADDYTSFSDDEISVTFSSGSSGNIKSLVISKHGADAQIRAYKEMFDAEDGRLVVYMPFSSYQQRLYVYGAIAFGFDLVLVPPYALFGSLLQTQPTVLMGPPILFETLAKKLSEGDTTSVRAALGGKMRIMTTGMAKIRQDAIDFFHRHGIRLCEGYGLGECGSVCVNTLGAQLPGSVGKPLPGTRLRLAQDGEILVNKEHPLLSRFLDHDSSSTDTEDTRLEDGWFHTGDLGRLDAQGNLYIEGRKKTTLVLNDGRKFQPEPVEKALEQAIEVKRAAISLSADQQGMTIGLESHGGDASTSPDIIARVRAWFSTYTNNAFLLVDVKVADTAFTPENGLLLRNFKLNRRAIACYFGWEE